MPRSNTLRGWDGNENTAGARGKMLCEGEKMLGEALRSGAKLKTVLVRDGWDSPLVKEAEEQGASLYSAPDALFKLASEVETPQNVIFFLRAAAVDGGRAGRSRAGAPAGRLTGPGQPWHDLTHRRSVRARRRCVVRGLRRSVFTQGRALDDGRGVPSAVRDAPCLRRPPNGCQNGLPLYATALHEDSVPLSSVSLSKAAVIIGSEERA